MSNSSSSSSNGKCSSFELQSRLKSLRTYRIPSIITWGKLLTVLRSRMVGWLIMMKFQWVKVKPLMWKLQISRSSLIHCRWRWIGVIITKKHSVCGHESLAVDFITIMIRIFSDNLSLCVFFMIVLNHLMRWIDQSRLMNQLDTWVVLIQLIVPFSPLICVPWKLITSSVSAVFLTPSRRIENLIKT